MEKLNDIYDIFKYDDTMRVKFAAFKLKRVAEDWWLRASEPRALEDQSLTWNDFQEEFLKEYILFWIRERREDEF